MLNVDLAGYINNYGGMSIFEAAISILAPVECQGCGVEGSALCEYCAAKFINEFGERCCRCNRLSPRSRTCSSCRHTGSPTNVWITTDYDGQAADLIRIYKFGHQRAAAESIARLISATFIHYNPKTDYLVVPVPTATSRIRERGFGHSELLAEKVAGRLNFPFDMALRRIGQNRQVGSKRNDRLKQLSSSFAVKNHQKIINQKILLVDDVVTTGGTLIAATKTLRDAGAKRVDALIFAKRL